MIIFLNYLKKTNLLTLRGTQRYYLKATTDTMGLLSVEFKNVWLECYRVLSYDSKIP